MITKDRVQHLLGLEFLHGSQDCYTMLRSVYKDIANIELTDYARQNDWWTHGEDLYLENFKSEGFKPLEVDTDLSELHPLDVFLIAIPDPRNRDRKTPSNHCAIYLGEDKIIHHRLGVRSEIKTYKGAIRNFTTHIIRHKDISYRKPEAQTLDMMDIILPSKKAMLLNGNS